MAPLPRPILSAAVLLGQGPRAPPPPTAAETRRLRVLVAEADPSRRQRLAAALSAAGEDAVPAPSWAAAQGALTRTAFDAMLFSLDLPQAGGLAAARVLRGWPPPVSGLVLLALHDGRTRVQEKDWRNAGVDALLLWPAALDDLAARIRAEVVSVTPPEPLDAARRAALLEAHGPEGLAARDLAALHDAATAMAALRAAEAPEAALAAAEAIAVACEGIGALAAAAAARAAGRDLRHGEAALVSALVAVGSAIRFAGRRR